MFQKLVSLNPDLKRLVDKGYAVSEDSNYLIVRDIPYLDEHLLAQVGAFVAKLVFVDKEHVVQDDHQVFFAGSVPYGLDGKPIPNLNDRATSLTLSVNAADVKVQRQFSNKPLVEQKFADFFEKIESYTTIISGPAIERDGANPLTFRKVGDEASSVFKFRDTLTSRAEITDLSIKFQDDVIAIIGLGGTGGYLLDFAVKTPAKEVRAFDADPFHVHNAFRSPGRVVEDEFGQPKADVYSERYDNFRTGLILKPVYIDRASAHELAGVTFAFVCVDKGNSRAAIVDLLIELGIPFIDVGMGLRRRQSALSGMVRTTYFPVDRAAAVRDAGWVELKEQEGDLYRTNIQIAELNALNAALAIIRFKQLRGFYAMEADYLILLLSTADLASIGVASTDED